MARVKIEDQRREEILRAFEACVARKGLAETTLNDVAAEAGLPRSLARYFVGNRDDMVELLIERMVTRAESSLSLLVQKHDAELDARTAVDYLFDKVLADDVSNAVVGELWYLARRDKHTRVTLRAVYARLAKELAALLGRDPRARAPKKDLESVAFSLLALAFGEASFRALGVKDVSSARVRTQAYRLVAALTAAGATGAAP